MRDPRPIDTTAVPRGSREDFYASVYETGLGNPVLCPFVLLRGAQPGPVVGICAAIHGNELAGINIIHHVLERLDPSQLSGTILCAPVANVPAFEAGQRRFPEDEKDLNHCFPGKREGTPSEQYARAFHKLFLEPLNYLIDIHTASEGRANTLYVRADLHSPEARKIAMLVKPEIVLHGRSGDGTLRNAASRLGIPAITLEAGNPSVFDGRMTAEGEAGVLHVLAALGMLHGDLPDLPDRVPVVCRSSRWLRTRSGGVLATEFGLGDQVEKRQVLARLRDPFGNELAKFRAPSDGVVIGMSRTPIAVPGTRYCHLGEVGEPELPRPARS